MKKYYKSPSTNYMKSSLSEAQKLDRMRKSSSNDRIIEPKNSNGWKTVSRKRYEHAIIGP